MAPDVILILIKKAAPLLHSLHALVASNRMLLNTINLCSPYLEGRVQHARMRALVKQRCVQRHGGRGLVIKWEAGPERASLSPCPFLPLERPPAFPLVSPGDDSQAPGRGEELGRRWT